MSSITNKSSPTWTFVIFNSIFVTLLSIWIHISSPISPSPPIQIPNMQLPPPNETDPLLIHTEHLFNTKLLAPEDGIQLNKNEWIWSLGDGNLVKVNTDTVTWEKFSQTGKNHKDCGELFMEEYCGRPLGLLLLPKKDYEIYEKYIPKQKNDEIITPFFLVADAYKGLLLALSNGVVVPILSSVHCQELYFTNALARASNGKIYISDTSSRFRRNQVIYEVLENQPNGRIVTWDPHTNKSEVVLDKLHSPNGIVLKDDTSLLISLTTLYQIIQYDIDTNTTKTFSLVPGFPDNIHITYMKEWKKHVLWVGLSSKITKVTKILYSYPQLRKVLSMLPYNILLKCFKKNGLLLAIDVDSGKIIEFYQDSIGRTPYISGILFDDFHGYIGSWKNDFLGRIKREDLLT